MQKNNKLTNKFLISEQAQVSYSIKCVLFLFPKINAEELICFVPLKIYSTPLVAAANWISCQLSNIVRAPLFYRLKFKTKTSREIKR